MTNERILSLINDFLETGKYSILNTLKEGITENIRVEVAKQKGVKVNELQVVKRIYKDVTDNNNNVALHGLIPFWFNGVAYNGLCNGYFITGTVSDYGYSRVDNPLKLADFFYDGCFEPSTERCEYIVNMEDLKLFIKTHKRTDRKPYILESELYTTGINAWYLKNMLDLCKTDRIILTGTKNPIFIKSDDFSKIALVLPVNLNYKREV